MSRATTRRRGESTTSHRLHESFDYTTPREGLGWTPRASLGMYLYCWVGRRDRGFYDVRSLLTSGRELKSLDCVGPCWSSSPSPRLLLLFISFRPFPPYKTPPTTPVRNQSPVPLSSFLSIPDSSLDVNSYFNRRTFPIPSILWSLRVNETPVVKSVDDSSVLATEVR